MKRSRATEELVVLSKPIKRDEKEEGRRKVWSHGNNLGAKDGTLRRKPRREHPEIQGVYGLRQSPRTRKLQQQQRDGDSESFADGVGTKDTSHVEMKRKDRLELFIKRLTEILAPAIDPGIFTTHLTRSIFDEESGDTYHSIAKKMLKLKRQLEEQIDELALALPSSKDFKHLLSKSAEKWQKSALQYAFRTWYDAAKTRKRQRKLIDQFFNKITKSRQKDIFRAWRRHTIQSLKTKALEQIKELKRKCNQFQDKRQEAESQILQVKELAREWVDKITHAKSTLEDVESLTQEAESKLELHMEAKTQHENMANVWMAFCLEYMSKDLEELEMQLVEIPNHEFRDPTLLGDPMELINMPVDTFLLCWANHHIKKHHGSMPTLASFSKVNVKAFIALLDEHFRQQSGVARVANIADSMPPLMASSHSQADMNVASFCYLFCKFPGLESEPWNVARDALEQVKERWVTTQDKVSVNPESLDTGHLATLGKDIEEVRRQVKWAISERDHCMSIWKELENRVRLTGWSILLYRLRGIPIQIQEKMPEIFDALPTALRGCYKEILSVFNHYCRLSPTYRDDDANAKMEMFALVAFLKDCRIIDRSRVSINSVRTVLQDEFKSNTRLTSVEFARTLPRIADLVHESQSQKTPLETTAKLSMLYNEFILPHACISPLEPFRKQVARLQVQNALQVHKSKLDEIIESFGDEHDTLSISSWFNVLSERQGLISDDALSRDDFNRIADTLVMRTGNLDRHDCHEFLCAIALELYPNPLINLQEKVGWLMQAYFT